MSVNNNVEVGGLVRIQTASDINASGSVTVTGSATVIGTFSAASTAVIGPTGNTLTIQQLGGGTQLLTTSGKELYFYPGNVLVGQFNASKGLSIRAGGLGVGPGASVSYDPSTGEIWGQNQLSTAGGASNAQAMRFRAVTSLLSTTTGTAVTGSALIPSGAMVLGATSRVVTMVAGATGYDFGYTGAPTAWGAAITSSVNTTSNTNNWTATGPYVATTNTDVILTAKTNSFSGGTVRVTIHYVQCDPPTS